MSTTPNYLFVAVFPTCYSYSDRTKEENGDYLSIGRVYFNPLRIEIFRPEYTEAVKIMQADMQDLSKKKAVEISATGQTAKISF